MTLSVVLLAIRQVHFCKSFLSLFRCKCRKRRFSLSFRTCNAPFQYHAPSCGCNCHLRCNHLQNLDEKSCRCRCKASVYEECRSVNKYVQPDSCRCISLNEIQKSTGKTCKNHSLLIVSLNKPMWFFHEIDLNVTSELDFLVTIRTDILSCYTLAYQDIDKFLAYDFCEPTTEAGDRSTHRIFQTFKMQHIQ